MRRLPEHYRNSRVQRERDLHALSRLAILLACTLFLAGGFLFAARQHFASVRYGYDTENLRSERQRLIEEQRQLVLQKEQASSPAQLEAAARKFGLRPIQARQVGTTKVSIQTQPRALINPAGVLSR